MSLRDRPMTAPLPGGTPDRFVTGEVQTSGVAWAPTDPAAIDQTPYREYLDRIERGEPTGRRRLQQLHPDAPCHTGGGGALSACPCGRAGWRGDPSGLVNIPPSWGARTRR